ncbi:hypothetical protein, partial [Paraglaciecola chathamensis]|uniref:hypothetical protein n=2 Tax=Pseudomonadota TaxID=1224 RepID=UPI0023570C3A
QLWRAIMKCECKQEIEARLLERAKEQLPNSLDHDVTLDGYSMIFGNNSISMKASMPVTIKHKVLVKKTGNYKDKKDKTNLIFSFCPFCGEKANGDES